VHQHSGELVLIIFVPVSDVMKAFVVDPVLSNLDPTGQLSLLMQRRDCVPFFLPLALMPSTGAPYMLFVLWGTTGLGLWGGSDNRLGEGFLSMSGQWLRVCEYPCWLDTV